MLDANKILEELTEDDIISILENLGCDNYRKHGNYVAFSTNICHGGSHLNLIYFRSSKSFYCFSGCKTSYSIYSLIQKANSVEFIEALKYVANFTGHNIEKEEPDESNLIEDWNWIKKLKKKDKKIYTENKILPIEILNQFISYSNYKWWQDGIYLKTQIEWSVMYDLKTDRIVYPLYSENNLLHGIKGRSYDDNVEPKYLYLYPCEKSLMLVGLNKTLPHILSEKKCLLFESFKSVMLAWQYGYKYACSIEGSSISEWQQKKLIELDCEIIIALDRGVEKKHLREIMNMFKNKSKISFIFDDNGLLKKEKSSPIDEGKEIFDNLYKNRYKVN